jgi:hypothetical protein
MEFEDIGIKDASDVLEALKAGAKATDLHNAYGKRIAGLLAVALDTRHAEHAALVAERQPGRFEALRDARDLARIQFSNWKLLYERTKAHGVSFTSGSGWRMLEASHIARFIDALMHGGPDAADQQGRLERARDQPGWTEDLIFGEVLLGTEE